jgi:hypothetical protein
MVGRSISMRIKVMVLGALVCLAMLAAAPAYAQTVNPTQDAYSITAARVQEQVTDSGDSDNSLPFTGMEVTVVLAGGLLLIGLGLGVRRMAKPARLR